jgi:membrane-bound lytic murein transglycosylase F
VADSNIASLNRRYYPDIRMAFPIEEKQVLAWAVKKGQKALLHEINIFFEEMRHRGSFAKIHQKYYGDAEIFDYVDLKKFHRRLETRLPRYREMIRRAAAVHGFDWRLIAAMVYQESHFDPRAQSHTGVRGMMQLTRETARELNITDRLDPEQSVRGGVRYLRRLYDRFQGTQDPDRLLMALASYNVGHGHVMDARKLARRQGLNPDSWAALRQVLPLLRYPKFYRQTRHGYCRGTEPVRYVDRIMTYYDILKREAIS